ncbi:transmembrane protein, putative [Medicago truncatula]|uniref:Transmembrane protein, putative n=1 Tax=Medicago truncatula TaxID=3880 RepID=G7L4L1_MEDTR|nr:transmembrane protein, putative [Medicago truncatula]
MESVPYTPSVSNYKTLLLKSRELRKRIFVLKLFVITIVFTILSLRERVSLCFPYVTYC